MIRSRITEIADKVKAGNAPARNQSDHEIVLEVAASIRPTVIGLPTWAVKTPRLIIVPLMAPLKVKETGD